MFYCFRVETRCFILVSKVTTNIVVAQLTQTQTGQTLQVRGFGMVFLLKHSHLYPASKHALFHIASYTCTDPFVVSFI